MSLLSQGKEDLKKGNIISGAFTGTMGVLVGPLVDVFTFGGTLDANDASDVWGNASNTYIEGERQRLAQKQAQEQQQRLLLERAAQAEADRRYQQKVQAFDNTLAKINTSTTQKSSSSNSTQNPSETRVPRTYASDLNHCLKIQSSSIGSFLINTCSGTQLWVEWYGVKNCKLGCAQPVTTKQSINLITENIRPAVCPYRFAAYVPNAPKPSDAYKWKGIGSFQCVYWGSNNFKS